MEFKKGSTLLDQIYKEGTPTWGCKSGVLDVEDVKDFIKQLKNIKKMWSDSGMECHICNKEQKLWVHGKSNCYYCEINKLYGSTFD